MAPAVGLDFGTTNSAVALARDGRVTLAEFPVGETWRRVFRSVLHFAPPEGGRPPPPLAGPPAIARFLDEGEGRLIQSLKSFLASKSFRGTEIYNRRYTLPDLLAYFLGELRRHAEARLGPLGSRAVVGRPVTFAGTEDGDAEALAERRLRQALTRAGFTEVTFLYEPVAASYEYEADLERDETVLIADFGGGTSDFCLLRVGPSHQGSRADDILATSGEPIAGDVFDARIVRHVIAPALGYGTRYDTFQSSMEVPAWLYAHLEKWHHLSFLKSRKTMALLVDIAAGSHAPSQLAGFLHLIRHDLGFALYRAVERAKVALSSHDTAQITLRDGPVDLDVSVDRRDFEAWIAADVDAIDGAVDRALESAGLAAAEVDRVFMTGGTSLVPAVHHRFARRFGAERVVLGDRFTSVAAGLARRAADLRTTD